MTEVWTMGEILVEIMRPRSDMPLDTLGEFVGPYPSGAPAIFIDTVARLGHSAGIVGGVGKDGFGKCVLDRLANDGVRIDRVERVGGGSTAVAFVSYSGDGSRRFIFHIDGTPAAATKRQLPEELGESRIFHVMGCSLMVNSDFRENIIETVKAAHAQGMTVTFDPNIRPELLNDQDLGAVVLPIIERTSILLPGLQELMLISGKSSLEEAISHIFETTPVETIVLKLGSRGCVVYTPSETIEVPAFRIDEVDPTGAGDYFDAGYLCGVLEGKSFAECGRLATAAGALNAAAFGPMEGDLARTNVDAFIAERSR